jgi:hypothetical protein
VIRTEGAIVEKVLEESIDTQAILDRMAEVRYDLDEDVQEIVEGARDMSQWRSYVRNYPWLCLGGALALGYLIVPRLTRGMKPDPHVQVELASPQPLPPTPASPLTEVRSMLLEFVGNLVMRGASAYALQQVDKLFATQADKSQQNVRP